MSTSPRHQRPVGAVTPQDPARSLISRFDTGTAQCLVLAAAATAFGVIALALRLGEEAITGGPLDYTLVVVAGVALLASRRWPLPVLILTLGLHLRLTAVTGAGLAAFPAFAVALYMAARTGRRRERLLICVLVAACSAVIVSALGREPFWFELIGELALSFLPIAIADAARMRSERWHERIEREADTRVQDERLRIARDLHDTVAHGLSTIAVQSGVASHLLQRDPGQARVALDAINSASKDSLSELRAMVGVLRSTDEAPRQPTAWDPRSVGDLVAAAKRNGCKVELQVEGAFPIDASNAALVACLRILQEALTNVARHAGPVATVVNIHHGDRTVELRVDNAPSKAAAHRDDIQSTGVGITGMAERAKALGGRLTAAPTAAGGFSVWAMLPYHPAE